MDRTGNEKLSGMNLNLPVAGNTSITENCMVAINQEGYAVEASKTAGLLVAGCAIRFVENPGTAGERKVPVRRGTFIWNNDGTINETDVLKDCYVLNAHTVTITPDGSSRAGKILAVEPDGITVEML